MYKRQFLGLPETGGGFYVVKLPVYGSFYKAGVRPGDVVESVNGIPLDSTGLIKLCIRDSGIKAVIAESFAEIFFGNSTGIGLPCVCASADDIAALTRYISCLLYTSRCV